MTKLTYVSNSHGDWCGIYVGDTLQAEGHSIPIHDWLDLIDTWNFNETSQQLEVDGDWCEANSYDPDEQHDLESEPHNRNTYDSFYIKKLDSDVYAEVSV